MICVLWLKVSLLMLGKLVFLANRNLAGKKSARRRRTSAFDQNSRWDTILRRIRTVLVPMTTIRNSLTSEMTDGMKWYPLVCNMLARTYCSVSHSTLLSHESSIPPICGLEFTWPRLIHVRVDTRRPTMYHLPHIFADSESFCTGIQII